VAALTVGGDEEALLTDGVSVDGVHVLRIDVGEMVLLRHGWIAVTLAAGGGDVEGVDGGLGVVFGKDGVGGAVAGGAGVVGRMLVDAADYGCSFVRVAGDTLHGLGVVGVGIGGDGDVAGTAVEATVHAGVEDVRIDAGVVAGCVLEGDVAVAGETVRLSVKTRGRRAEEKSGAESEEDPRSNEIPCSYRDRGALLDRAQDGCGSREGRFGTTRLNGSESSCDERGYVGSVEAVSCSGRALGID